MADESLSLTRRLWLAFGCFFRVLLDAAFARRVALLGAGEPPLPDTTTDVATSPRETPTTSAPASRDHDGALGLLSIFQREGRLVDFLQQDVDGFPDAEIGAAARVVHAGCRRALALHVDLARVRPEPEGATITVSAGDAAAVKLTGNVRGSAPHRGVLRHAGWRVEEIRLPEMLTGHDARVVYQAEVEL